MHVIAFASRRLLRIADRFLAEQIWTELPELITSVAFTRDGKLAIAGSFVGICVSSFLCLPGASAADIQFVVTPTSRCSSKSRRSATTRNSLPSLRGARIRRGAK